MTSSPLPSNTYTVTDNRAALSLYFETVEEARAVAAAFPKLCKAHATRHSGHGWQEDGRGRTIGVAYVSVMLVANRANGGRNETGWKRIEKAVRHARAAGFEVTYSTPYSNSLPVDPFAEEVAR